MKKTSLLFVFVILMLSVFVSCDSGISDSNMNDEEITIMYPVFMESTSKDNGSRGLQHMTDETQNSPFTDTGVAQGIMSSMPCLAGIKPVVIKKNALVSSLTEAFSGTVYPFGFKCIRKMIKPNSDGMYCYYDIYDGDEWVGFFDYYYNWNTKRFSYKQLTNVTVTHDSTVLIFIEYNDVDIEGFDTSSPKFSVGQLKEDGSFETNATLTQIDLNQFSGENPYGRCAYQTMFITAKSDGRFFGSIMRPDATLSLTMTKYSNANYLDQMRNMYTDFYNSHSSDTRVFDMDNLFDVMCDDTYMTDLPEIRTHISTGASGILGDGYYPKGYNSYSEYTSLSFTHISDGLSQELKSNAEAKVTHVDHDNASVFDFINKKTASVQFSYKLYHNNGGGHCDSCIYCTSRNGHGGTPSLFNLSNNKEEIEQIENPDLSNALSGFGIMGCISPYTMFKSIFDLKDNPVENPTQEQLFEYRWGIAKRILLACGLSDVDAENYAKNIVYSETQIALGNNNFHYIPITAEPFSSFKNTFDGENGLQDLV